jgi:hypothetical protein
MLAIEVLRFWLVVSVAFFCWRRLTMPKARVSRVVSESHGHRA